MAEDTVFYLSNDPNDEGIPLFIEGTLTSSSYLDAGKGITNSNLVRVEIGTTVTSIGSQAFFQCSELQSVTIPDSVTSIGGYAFNSCTALESVTIPDSVESIGIGAFSSCIALQSATIGTSVTSISNSAFLSCKALQYVTIPDSVESIGESAFTSCTALNSLTIPDSVTTISDTAFENSGLETLYMTSNNGLQLEGGSDKVIGGKTVNVAITVPPITKFYINTIDSTPIELDIEEQLLPSSYLDAEKGITKSNLVKVEIGTKVTSIGYDAFYDCRSLQSLTIPDSVTSIGAGAFWDCTALQSVTIGDSVTIIGNYAFRGCRELQSLTLPTNVNFRRINGAAFSGCILLKSVTIPDSVKSIGISAFDGCSGLKSVTIGNSVTSISQYAFRSCSKLQNLTVNGNCVVENFVSNSFQNSTSLLKNVVLGNSVTKIGQNAFKGCGQLTVLTIPNSVTKIGQNAFENSGISTVTMGVATASLLDLTPNSSQEFFGQSNVFIQPTIGAAFIQPGIISGDGTTLDDWSTDVQIALRYYKPSLRTFEKSREGLFIADLTKIAAIENVSINKIKWLKKIDGEYTEQTAYEDKRTYPYNGNIVKVECRYSVNGSETTVMSKPTITDQTTIDTIVDNVFETVGDNFTNAEFRKTLTKVSFNNNITTISDDGLFVDESFVYENMQEVEVPKTVTSIKGTPFPQNTRYYIRSIQKYLKTDTYTPPDWVNDTNKQLYFYLNETSFQQNDRLAKTRANDGVDMNISKAPFNYDSNNKKHRKCEDVEYLYETETDITNNITITESKGVINTSQNTKGHINIKTNIYEANKYVGGIASAGGSYDKSYYMEYDITNPNQADETGTRKEYETSSITNYNNSTFTIDKSTLKFNPGVITPLNNSLQVVITPTDNEYLRLLNVVLKYGTTEKTIRIGIASTTWGNNQDYDNSCFPGNSQLILKDGTKKIFHDIEVGDEIQVCSKDMELSYSKVIFLPHLQNNTSTEYIKFTTTSNQTIRASNLHLLPVLDKNNTLQNVIAKKITKEDKLYVLNNGKGVPEQIKTIETVQEEGAYTCLVKEEEYIVVDNIVACQHAHCGDGPDESYISKYVFSYNMMRLYAKGFSILDSMGVLNFTAPLLRSIALYLSKWRWTR